MGEKHMERVEDDFLKTNNCTQEELDINMFDIKNSLMSCVEETTDGDCCRVIPIFNGDNHKEKVMFFYKEKFQRFIQNQFWVFLIRNILSLFSISFKNSSVSHLMLSVSTDNIFRKEFML